MRDTSRYIFFYVYVYHLKSDGKKISSLAPVLSALFSAVIFSNLPDFSNNDYKLKMFLKFVFTLDKILLPKCYQDTPMMICDATSHDNSTLNR